MDFNQEQIFRMQQFDAPKIPFYMSYPMQNLYLTEMEYEKDMDRMKELYPRDVKRILEYAEEECDKMEYEGSLMFDEYPDRLMLEQITNRIYEQVKNNDEVMQSAEYGGGHGMGRPPHHMPPPGRPPHHMPPPPPYGSGNDLRDLIGVILNNEMYRRRCRHRRCRRWW